MSKDKVLTVSVPYLPPYDSDIQPPEWFEKNVKTFGKSMPNIEDYELDEIQGTRLVILDSEWQDHGHVAIYRLKESLDV